MTSQQEADAILAERQNKKENHSMKTEPNIMSLLGIKYHQSKFMRKHNKVPQICTRKVVKQNNYKNLKTDSSKLKEQMVRMILTDRSTTSLSVSRLASSYQPASH